MSAPRSRWSGDACRSIVTWKRAHRARAGFARVPARRCTSGQTEFNVMVTRIDRGIPSTPDHRDFPCPCMHVQRAVPWNQREKGEEVIELSALEFPTGGFQLNCHWRNSVNFPTEIISFTSGLDFATKFLAIHWTRIHRIEDEKGKGNIYIYGILHVALTRKNLCDEHVLIRRSFSKWSINPKSCSAGNRVRRSKRAISRLMYLFYLWLTSDP